MVPEFHILFPVQHLQKRGGGIALIVAADLVNLVQKHQGIAHAGLTHAFHDTARHGAHVGFPMASDFRLVPDTSQADAHVFLIQSPGHGPGNGCFAGSGRSHQTDDRACALLRQGADSQVFQDPLLYLLQPVVILVEYLLGVFDVVIVLGHLLPGQVQQGFHIGAQHIGLLASGRHIAETLNLFVELFLYLLVGLQSIQLFLIFVCVRHSVLSQLLADDLHLLPENIFLLVLVDIGLYLFLKFLLDSVYLHLGQQSMHYYLIPGRQGAVFQHSLADGIVPWQLYGNLVQHLIQICNNQQIWQNFLCNLRIDSSIFFQFIFQNTQHSLLSQAVQVILLRFYGSNLTHHSRFLGLQA